MEKKRGMGSLFLLQAGLAVFLALIFWGLCRLYPTQGAAARSWLSDALGEEAWTFPLSQENALPALTAPLGSLTITSAYGVRGGEVHDGVDLAAEQGEPVYAAQSGTVTVAETSDSYGNWIELSHADGYATRYAHCFLLAVDEGESVQAGQLIALAGQTGDADGVHLHFELLKDGAPVDPTAALGL